jgi:hypothetical protein
MIASLKKQILRFAQDDTPGLIPRFAQDDTRMT